MVLTRSLGAKRPDRQKKGAQKHSHDLRRVTFQGRFRGFGSRTCAIARKG
jgi:hypothetical protein